MEELLALYWPVIVLALIVGLIAGYFAFRPKQRISLSDDGPNRPHMTPADDIEGEHGLIGTAAEGTAYMVAEVLGADIYESLPKASGSPDDLTKLKGVGPKLASMLAAMGLVRFDQIAKLSGAQLEAIDSQLGAFKGRLARDRIVEQADYLARGDTEGYEARFGNL